MVAPVPSFRCACKNAALTSSRASCLVFIGFCSLAYRRTLRFGGYSACAVSRKGTPPRQEDPWGGLSPIVNGTLARGRAEGCKSDWHGPPGPNDRLLPCGEQTPAKSPGSNCWEVGIRDRRAEGGGEPNAVKVGRIRGCALNAQFHVAELRDNRIEIGWMHYLQVAPSGSWIVWCTPRCAQRTGPVSKSKCWRGLRRIFDSAPARSLHAPPACWPCWSTKRWGPGRRHEQHERAVEFACDCRFAACESRLAEASPWGSSISDPARRASWDQGGMLDHAESQRCSRFEATGWTPSR